MLRPPAVHLPALGGEYAWTLVAVHKRYPHQARQIASALWGSPALRHSRFLVIVDAEIDLRDARAVCREVGSNVAIERDVFSYDGPAAAVNSPGMSGLERHLGIDATTKIAGETDSTSAARLLASDEIVQRVTARWHEFRLGDGGSQKAP